MEQKVMIELDGLKKYFSIEKGLVKKKVTYVKAVDDITLNIHEGEIVGLVGESGSGKTTLARVILNLSKMTGGNILIDGINLSKASRDDIKRLRSEIAVVFQDPASNLNPQTDGRKFYYAPYDNPRRSQRRGQEKRREMFWKWLKWTSGIWTVTLISYQAGSFRELLLPEP